MDQNRESIIDGVLEQIAARHNLDARGKCRVMRCAAALAIFEEGHPERTEVEAMLTHDPALQVQVSEFEMELEQADA